MADLREAIWNAINEYTLSCHGDPGQHVYGNVLRQKAVASVEKVIRDIKAERDQERAKKAERSNDDLARYITKLSAEVQRVTAERDQAIRERDEARCRVLELEGCLTESLDGDRFMTAMLRRRWEETANEHWGPGTCVALWRHIERKAGVL